MKKVKKIKNNLPDLPDNVVKTGKRAGKVVGEFKEFISRGNVTDMAVGIIVGSAFTAIARSFADDVLMPLIGIFLGGIDLTGLSFTFNSFVFPDYSVTIKYGNFLQAIVGFFIIAISVFFIIKTLNTIRSKLVHEEEPQAEPEPTAEVLLLTEIRDLLKGTATETATSSPAAADLLKSKLPDSPKS